MLTVTATGNIGNVTSNTVNGQTVLNFSVATTKRWVTNGEKRESTTWIKFSAWGERATALADVIPNAKSVFCTGELQAPRIYQNTKGEHVASLEARLDVLEVTSWKPSDATKAEKTGEAAPKVNDADIPF